MGVKEYLEKTSVFTIEDFRKVFPTVTGYNLLCRAVKSGKAYHISRGLYASNTGRFADVRHDRFGIAAKLAADTVFAFHSALELFGVAHSTTSRVQYFSSKKKNQLIFQDNVFKRYPLPDREELLTQTVRISDLKTVRVTTKEQTLLDCMTYLGRGGGVEEVLRSVSGFPYLDVEIIKSKATSLTSSSIARIGWLLEQKQQTWDVAEKDLDFLQNLLKGTTAHRFVSRKKPNNGWSKRWRLILPASATELSEWTL
jgi:predicted transcriptional regulator of viral defense system